MNNDNFIMLPNNLVWNNENKENTFLEMYGDKIVHIFMYLACSTNRFNKTLFTIKDIIISCDLTPKSGKNKINDQFKNILINLKSNGIIETDVDFNSIKINECINCKFNMPILKDKFQNNTMFFTISVDDYLSILGNNISKIDKLILLKVYAYINARINRGEDKPQCFYDSYSAICNDLKIHENTFKNCIKQLNDIGLVYFDNIGLIEKNNKVHTANNVYCLNEIELDKSLDQSKDYYCNKGYKIVNAKCNKDMQKLNGLKGKIQQQQNLGKNTSNLEGKLTLLENKTLKNNEFKLKINNKIIPNNSKLVKVTMPTFDVNFETGEFTKLTDEEVQAIQEQKNEEKFSYENLPF
ncbi:hypothetical protein ADU80_05045 [Clostridium botulinum]|uniref:hypothetical protein n=1 Tax=Clostridium botulinum TaxID=1491 RepID=UPI0002075AA6|nr:hypothetical protein [Clostridium botulinum]AEB77613.1 hypothetical protein CbC4_7002 [Clostridium botulinum BKT015925]KLU74178.1 hypothetical protein CBC3_p0318 [Clostridium botulinum V891]KOA76615.1 hypothetical protein ADU78_05920 [Clostridium botulinum]KOA86427.1 hypothetical protein ADU80_05045 [Clostridium botulinum]KOC34072.1 hypothetical protein ADU82_10855 [Clostridium botulinum]